MCDSPAASFANCVMTLYLLKVHLQMFLSIPVTQKRQILSSDTSVANERCIYHQLPPTCFGVYYTIFRQTIALLAQELYALCTVAIKCTIYPVFVFYIASVGRVAQSV